MPHRQVPPQPEVRRRAMTAARLKAVVARLRRSFSDRRIAVIGSLAILSLFVVAMIAFRILYTRTPEHGAIAWNLLLAWIPFALALVVYERARCGGSTPSLAALGVLWL